MKLSRRFDRAVIVIFTIAIAFLFGCFYKVYNQDTYAEGDDDTFLAIGPKFVTFYDGEDKLTVKTEAVNVGEALERAGIVLNDGDKVEPGLDAEINAENFFINIYRARPVVVKDGVVEKYLMTASYDAKSVASEAGVTIYDGDIVEMVPNESFLENGVANVYEVTRNGGRTLTIEEEIPFTEEEVKDENLEFGKSEVRQLGEVGRKRIYYNIQYIDNKEVSRELVREEVVQEPVARVTATGTKPSAPPASGTCADWVRAAGVAEADVNAAVDLIYHESGCRVDASNAGSGAYGIPQALPGSKMASAGADWETNPITQIRWMADYVQRYGGWQGALSFWYAHHWY